MSGFLSKSKNKIYFKGLILNFTVLTCLVLIYQIASYFYFNESYKQRLTDTFANNSIQSKNILDNTILKTEFEILNTYFNTAAQPSASFNKFLTADIINIDDILDISQIMHKLVYLYPNIQGIKIYSSQNNLLFKNGFVTYLEDASIENQTNADMQVFKSYFNEQKRQVWLYNEDTRTVSFILALPYYSFNNAAYSVICFDTAIDSFLSALDGSLDFALLNEEGSLLYSSENLALKGYTEEIAQMKANGETQKLIKGKQHGNVSVQMLAKSDYSGLYYLFGMQSDSLTDTFLFSVLGLILINAVLLGVFCIISYVFTKQLHKPLERIIKAARGALSSQYHTNNDYNLLESTVENVHELRNKIDSNSGIIHEKMVRSLLDGTFNSTQFAENYKASKVSFDCDYVFSVIIKLFNENFEQAIALAHQLHEENSDYRMYTVYIASKNEIYAVVNTIYNSADIVVEQMQQKLDTVAQLKYNVFTGNVYELHEQNIYLSMCEAKDIVEYCYIMQNTTVLFYSVYTNTVFISTADQSSKLALVQSALQNKNVQVAHQKCLEYLHALISFEYDIIYIRKSVLDIILCIKNVLAQASAVQCNEVAELGSRSMQNNIFELEQHFSNIVFPAIEKHFEDIKDDVSLESQLMRIINEAPYESITLDYIASKLNMRNCAFSKAFKAITNMNFIDYVKNMKLEYAAKLLSESGLAVKDISAKLGYNTPHYFIKIFKERYSCTPKQYQNMRIADSLRQENESNEKAVNTVNKL